MFGFFKRSGQRFDLIDTHGRKFFEQNMLWLQQEFSEPRIEDRKILKFTEEDFPVEWNGKESSASAAFDIIANNMQIDRSEVELHYFVNPNKEISAGGSSFFLGQEEDSLEAAGLYHHKNEQGKYEISIDKELLRRPEALIATMAHELAHVKLLGHLEMTEADEHLTDLATVFFGLGIFNAHAGFEFYKSADRWGYAGIGYLKQEEWAYALALFAFMRHEDTPEWRHFLKGTISNDFDKCLKYMIENESSIFESEN